MNFNAIIAPFCKSLFSSIFELLVEILQQNTKINGRYKTHLKISFNISKQLSHIYRNSFYYFWACKCFSLYIKLPSATAVSIVGYDLIYFRISLETWHNYKGIKEIKEINNTKHLKENRWSDISKDKLMQTIVFVALSQALHTNNFLAFEVTLWRVIILRVLRKRFIK